MILDILSIETAKEIEIDDRYICYFTFINKSVLLYRSLTAEKSIEVKLIIPSYWCGIQICIIDEAKQTHSEKFILNLSWIIILR